MHRAFEPKIMTACTHATSYGLVVDVAYKLQKVDNKLQVSFIKSCYVTIMKSGLK